MSRWTQFKQNYLRDIAYVITKYVHLGSLLLFIPWGKPEDLESGGVTWLTEERMGGSAVIGRHKGGRVWP